MLKFFAVVIIGLFFFMSIKIYFSYKSTRKFKEDVKVAIKPKIIKSIKRDKPNISDEEIEEILLKIDMVLMLKCIQEDIVEYDLKRYENELEKKDQKLMITFYQKYFIKNEKRITKLYLKKINNRSDNVV